MPIFRHEGHCPTGSRPRQRSRRGTVATETTHKVQPERCYSPECVEGKFCELRLYGVLGSSPAGGKSRLLSGGRHRRGVAQQQLLLRGQDDRRVHTPHPPNLRRRPLVDRLLYGRRLDHQSASVDQLAQLPLLLEGRLELDRLHPVEGSPNGATLDAALLLDELPELSPAASAQGLFLRSHEQPSLPL